MELLLANGAREQDVRSALAISIKRGDSQIISLLLKKLSLDVANSSICLGGFGIGRLEPSWLIPLFPDKLTPLRKQSEYTQNLLYFMCLYILMVLIKCFLSRLSVEDLFMVLSWL